jgi:plasmid replication initiation protein
MGKIESKTGRVKQSDEKIYNFLSDFNNFQNLIPPDKVKNWKSTSDSCQFTVDGIGDAAMKIIEKKPFSLIKITSEGKTPISFILWLEIKKIGEKESGIKIVIEPMVNPMIMMMVKGPLQSFVDMLVDQMEKLTFRQESGH